MEKQQQTVSWVQECRETRQNQRLMAELFGEEDEMNLDLGASEQNNDQGECSPTVPCKSILTMGSSGGSRKITDSAFLRHCPALMDPRNFLQLITKFAAPDIVAWANDRRPECMLTLSHVNVLQLKAIKLMGERTPGGEKVLRQSLEVVRSHNRLHVGKHPFTAASRKLIPHSVDAWYQAVSKATTTSDVTRLPLYYSRHAVGKEALTLLLGSSGIQPMGLILHTLLHDPLFPYPSLEEIPDHVLLEVCTHYSYPHVLDKLKVNSQHITATQEDIKDRVERLITAGVLWKPTETMDNDHAQESESGDNQYHQRCGNCIDDGVVDCTVQLRATRSGHRANVARFQGQRCTRCVKLKHPCEDRSTNECRASLASDKFNSDYHKSQKFGGHLIERVAENKMDKVPANRRARQFRAQIYALLPSGITGRSETLVKRSTLCLPHTPDDVKLRCLIDSISHAGDIVQEETNERALADDDELDDETAEMLVNRSCMRI